MKRNILFYFLILFINVKAREKDSLNARFSVSAVFFAFNHKISPQNDTTIVGFLKERNATSNISFNIAKNFNCGIKLHAAKFKNEYYTGLTDIVKGYLIGPFAAWQYNKTNDYIFAAIRASYLFGNFFHTDSNYYHFIVVNKKNTRYLALDLEFGIKLTRNIGLVAGFNFSKAFFEKKAYGYNYPTIGLQYSLYKKNLQQRTVFKNVRNL